MSAVAELEADEVAPPLGEGELLAPGYRVVDHLARGRVLDVYGVWSTERDCLCVAKVLRPDRLQHKRSRTRLRLEGRLVMKLSHPHIVRGYELIERDDPVLVLEALTGETLENLIDRLQRRLPATELAALGMHLSSAMGYLHNRGFLHLDLKPSNIVCESGQARVIDLSVSRPPGPVRRPVGTRIYMAPEQCRSGFMAEATDVWGIGGVLYEAAVGRRAFQGREKPEGYPQLARRADSIRAHRRLPRALADAIDACLEPDPALRPSMRELAAVLDPFA
jgi:serine/threonine protein kinase